MRCRYLWWMTAKLAARGSARGRVVALSRWPGMPVMPAR